MQALGFHYLIELHGCARAKLMNAPFLEELFQQAVRESGATEVGRVFHNFSPEGVSGVILISESHFSIHTWPEHGYAAVDLFTCSTTVDVQLIYQQLISALESKTHSIIEIKRGQKIPNNN